MSEQELTNRIIQLDKRMWAAERKLILLQEEWSEYEKSYKAYIHKRYRVRNWLFKIYYRLRRGKNPGIKKMTAKRMARIFAK